MAENMTSGTTGRTGTDSPTNASGGMQQQQQQNGTPQQGDTGLSGAAHDVMDKAKSSLSSATSAAKDSLGSMAESGQKGAAEAIDGVADALHKSAENFTGQNDFIAQLIDRGSSELGTLATTLRSNDLQGLLGKLDDLARREPAVFVGAAMAAGFAAVRLGKVAVAGASSDDLPKVEMPKVKETANEPG